MVEENQKLIDNKNFQIIRKTSEKKLKEFISKKNFLVNA